MGDLVGVVVGVGGCGRVGIVVADSVHYNSSSMISNRDDIIDSNNNINVTL